LPDGVPDSEHAEPGRGSHSGEARRNHPRDWQRQERGPRSGGARRAGSRRDPQDLHGDGAQGARRAGAPRAGEPPIMTLSLRTKITLALLATGLTSALLVGVIARAMFLR